MYTMMITIVMISVRLFYLTCSDSFIIVPSDFPGFIFFYVWMGWITSSALLYFFYNNKISPEGNVLEFKSDGNS